MSRKVVFIDGVRTPFLRTNTDYKDLMSYELGKFAIKGLLQRTGIDPNVIDMVVMGTVISNVRTSNVAREAAITAGIPSHVPCHTVTQACISANQAVASGVNAVMNGQADIFVAGGVDNVSDVPILFKKKMRKKLLNAQKLKGFGDTLKFVLSLRPSDFAPDAPAVAEFLTDRTMGQDCELMANRFEITRQSQDEFAARSHQLAAQNKNKLAKEIVPVEVGPDFKAITEDNGVRGDTTAEKISKLKPAFSKPHGTLTAANSSFLTDGATAGLFMTEEKAKELGLKPKAYVHDFTFSAQRLEDELLLGPTYATSHLLKKTNLTLEDIDVFEFHEAFAGQIMSNLACLNSDSFAKENLGRDKAVGKIPMDKFNLWGGSLSIGHPFGATGVRLVTTAANRLIEENGRYALLAACAAGAHGHAMILEKYNA